MTDNIVSLDDYRHKDDIYVLYLVEETDSEQIFASIPLEALRNLAEEGRSHWLLDDKTSGLWYAIITDYINYLETRDVSG